MKNNEPNMNDERLKLLIQRELDGEILPEEEAELQQALGENEELAARYEEDRRLAALIARDRQGIGVPRGFAETIGDRVFAGDQAQIPKNRLDLMRYLKPLSMVASVLVLIGVAFWVGQQSVTAESDVFGAGLLREKQLLLENHPELDPAEVEKVYRECVQSLDGINERAKSERNAAFGKLEDLIEKQILKRKHKGPESK